MPPSASSTSRVEALDLLIRYVPLPSALVQFGHLLFIRQSPAKAVLWVVAIVLAMTGLA